MKNLDKLEHLNEINNEDDWKKQKEMHVFRKWEKHKHLNLPN